MPLQIDLLRRGVGATGAFKPPHVPVRVQMVQHVAQFLGPVFAVRVVAEQDLTAALAVVVDIVSSCEHLLLT